MKLEFAALLAAIPGCWASTYRIGYEVMPQIVGAIDSSPPGTQFDAPWGAGYDGVVELLLTKSGSTSLCSGALIAGGWSVLTAGHCVTDTAGRMVTSRVQVVFYNDPSGSTTYDSVTTPMTVLAHPGWTGDLFLGNDLALINLSAAAPAGTQWYGLYSDTDEIGKPFNVAGFGRTGSGATGDSGSSGDRRQGWNIWDGTLADMALQGVPANPSILVSDFDDGTEEHDGWGYYFGIRNFLTDGSLEAFTARGDSGGPSFIDGQIAGITSFGMRITDDGHSTDIDAFLNSTFGEFNGMTRVSAYDDWIYANMVPEPGSFGLMAIGLSALVSRLARARRKTPSRGYTGS